MLIGRVRAAAVGFATFVATVLVGFAIIPGASRFYWLQRHFDDPKRIAPDPSVSTSVSGLIARLHYPSAAATAVVIVLAVTGLVLARSANRRGQPVFGVAIVGLTSAAISLFSWSHHWVWFAALLVHLAHRACIESSRLAHSTMWALWAVLAGWPTGWHGNAPPIGLASLRPGGLWSALFPSTYVFVLAAVLLAGAVSLRRAALPSAPSGHST